MNANNFLPTHLPKQTASRIVSAGRMISAGAITLALMHGASGAAPGESLWKFNADFGVTVVEPVSDLSGNGGVDVLIGSQDDSLYLVEGKGPHAGNQLW